MDLSNNTNNNDNSALINYNNINNNSSSSKVRNATSWLFRTRLNGTLRPRTTLAKPLCPTRKALLLPLPPTTPTSTRRRRSAPNTRNLLLLLPIPLLLTLARPVLRPAASPVISSITWDVINAIRSLAQARRRQIHPHPQLQNAAANIPRIRLISKTATVGFRWRGSPAGTAAKC